MKLFFSDNLGQKVVENLGKLGKIDFAIDYFRCDLSRIFSKNSKIWLFGVWQCTCNKINAF